MGLDVVILYLTSHQPSGHIFEVKPSLHLSPAYLLLIFGAIILKFRFFVAIMFGFEINHHFQCYIPIAILDQEVDHSRT